MPRPNLGPRLALIRNRGWRRARYYIRWTEHGRTRRLATRYDAADPEGAARFFEAWMRRRAKARAQGPGDPAQVRVAELIEDYALEHGPAVASPESLATAATPLLYFFAADTVASLTPSRVRQYWAWRRGHAMQTVRETGAVIAVPRPPDRPIADGTVIRELAGTLRAAIRHAVHQRRLAPGAYHVPVPPRPPGRDAWITRGEAARLLRESRRDRRSRLHLPLYVMLALYTGQRRGAILDLTWRQVDLVRGRIDFNPPGRTRTRKGRPVIPIPRPLWAALRRAHARASCEHVIAYRGERVLDVKTAFNSAAARAGIPECTSHTLRHTAGTMMAQRGVPLYEIAGYLGHSEARTTELYLHHHPSFLSNARRAMEER